MEKGLIRVSVIAFCHDGNGRYLFSKRSAQCRDEQGVWEPAAGGGLKFGETVVDAAAREIKEEVAATVKALDFLGYRDVHRIQEGKPTHWVAFDFKVLVDPADVRIGEPHKCDALQWLTISEIENFSEPLHSQFPVFFEKYKTILV